MDVVWLDLQMWTGLRGHLQPFTDVGCDAPDPPPHDTQGWQDWATAYLDVVARNEGWQPGRYHYTVERRDEQDHILQVFARGYWELSN